MGLKFTLKSNKIVWLEGFEIHLGKQSRVGRQNQRVDRNGFCQLN